MLINQKRKKAFEPQTVGGKTNENAKDCGSSFNIYCKLNKIDGKDKILMYEMCLSDAAKTLVFNVI